MTVLVFTIDFMSNAGGVTVLHKLCDLLRQRGVDARVWVHGKGLTYAGYRTPLGNGSVDPRDCVVIYPEVVTGNPLKARVVVRWLLNEPGLIGGDGRFGPDDLIVSFAPLYSRRYPRCEELCILELWPEHVHDRDAGTRHGGCYVVRKGLRKRRLPEIDRHRELRPHELTPPNVGPILRSSDVFYSYDAVTFLSLQAALCGCASVVVQEPGLSKARWVELLPLFRFGVAYGLEDAAWSERTRHLVPEWLAAVGERSAVQVDRLIHRMRRAWDRASGRLPV